MPLVRILVGVAHNCSVGSQEEKEGGPTIPFLAQVALKACVPGA